jgi:hypothetical protein
VDCEKVVKRDAFLKAIEVEDAPSATEGLDLDNMVVEPSYDGVKLEDGMTLEFIEDMIERFKNGKKIAKKYVYMIIIEVMKIIRKEPTMVEFDVEEGHEITVCGDTHGSSSRHIITNLLLEIERILTIDRPILRPHGDLPTGRETHRETFLPIQRRLCRSRVMVN